MVTIFIASHLDVGAPSVEHLKLIRAGAARSSQPGSCERDDDGENISSKNESFCELTVLYWMWKNTTADVIGLCHHRRLFSPVLLPETLRRGAIMTRELADHLLSADPMGTIYKTELELSDMIIPTRTPHSHGSAEMYCASHRASDWEAMMASLALLYPDEHNGASVFFSAARDLHLFNMFIARRPVLDAYCSWLFPLLFDLETRIVPDADPYQRRVFGFVAERLFNWWTFSRGIRLTERPVLFVQ